MLPLRTATLPRRLLGLALLLAALAISASVTAQEAIADDGLITVRSAHDIDETLARLQSALEANDFRVVAVVDHAAGAASVDLELLPTRLVIFGRPQAGTPLMQFLCEALEVPF